MKKPHKPRLAFAATRAAPALFLVAAILSCAATPEEGGGAETAAEEGALAEAGAPAGGDVTGTRPAPGAEATLTGSEAAASESRTGATASREESRTGSKAAAGETLTAEETPAGDAETLDALAARVDETPITVSRVRERIGQMSEAGAARADFRTALEVEIDRALLVNAAERTFSERTLRRMRQHARSRIEAHRDPRRPSSSDRELEQTVYHDLLIASYLDRECDSKVEITPEEVRSYYEENAASYARPAALVVRQILIRTGERSSLEAKATAEAALFRIEAGEDFDAVAREVSEGPYAENGGLWPAGRPSDLINAVAERVSSANEGEIVGPFESPLGWHVARVEERRDERVTPFAEVQGQIRERLRQSTQRRRRVELLRRLRSDAVIRVFTPQAGGAGSPRQP